MDIKKYEPELIESLKTLVSIPSFYSDSDKYPFGEAIDKVGHESVKLMENLGFKTYIDPKGYYAYAEIGEGDLFGILGHLDVVPARKEDGWDTDPFKPEIKDGRLYGRGTQDDKGPTLAAVYAVKALMDEGAKLNCRIRFIFGMDEESSWRCIDAYKEKEEAPLQSFTPDSAFPAVYAEKGLLQLELKSDQPASVDFSGGNSYNSVPPAAYTANDKNIQDILTSQGSKFTDGDDGKIEVHGLSAHAKNPWLGDSAVYRLTNALSADGYKDNTIDFINNFLNGKDRFEGFSDKDLSDFSGPVSVNLGKVTSDKNGSTLCLDLRLPVTLDKDVVVDIVKAKAEPLGFTVRENDWLKPIHLPLDSKMVSTMLRVYSEVTGDTTSKPIVSGGATYARAFDNCIAFGANFPGAETTEHKPNENIEIKNLLMAMDIYYRVIKELCTE